ncbi:MAG: CBS domain-containing protein [Parachlamydiaceae bacterium]|nr:CBS domain-containing protein [Parachlamydiaceae bacterium]
MQKIIEEQSDEESVSGANERLNVISANIFSLRAKDVKQVMTPIGQKATLPSNATVKQFEILTRKNKSNFIPIYHKEISNIVGIAYPRDLLRAGDKRRVRDYARRPWFVTETISMTQILKQFRNNKESVGVVLNREGNAVGLIHLNDVLEEIFGEFSYNATDAIPPKKQIVLMEKTFPGEMTVGQFQALYDEALGSNSEKTLSEFIIDHLGHRPEKGETFNFDSFEFTIKEVSLLDIKSVCISTRIK